MTRIGRCQIKTHNLLAMLPPGEIISPAQIPDQIASINTSVPTSLVCLVAARALDKHPEQSHCPARESRKVHTKHSPSETLTTRDLLSRSACCHVETKVLPLSEGESVETSSAFRFVSVVLVERQAFGGYNPEQCTQNRSKFEILSMANLSSRSAPNTSTTSNRRLAIRIRKLPTATRAMSSLP